MNNPVTQTTLDKKGRTKTNKTKQHTTEKTKKKRNTEIMSIFESFWDFYFILFFLGFNFWLEATLELNAQCPSGALN